MSGSTKRSRLQAFDGDADAVDLEVKQPAAKKARRVKVAKSASDAVASLVAQVNKNFAACSDSKKYGSLPKYQSDGKWQRRWKAVVSAFDNKEAETAKDCPDSDEIAGKPVAAVSDPTIPAGSFASFEEAKAAVKPALDVDDADSAEQMAMPSPFVQRRIDAMSMKLRANPAAFLDFDMTDTLVLLFEPNRRLLIRPLGMHETTIQGVLLRLVQSTLLGRRAGDLTLDMNEMSLVSDVCQVMEGHDHPVYCSLLETIQAHLARYDAASNVMSYVRQRAHQLLAVKPCKYDSFFSSTDSHISAVYRPLYMSGQEFKDKYSRIRDLDKHRNQSDRNTELARRLLLALNVDKVAAKDLVDGKQIKETKDSKSSRRQDDLPVVVVRFVASRERSPGGKHYEFVWDRTKSIYVDAVSYFPHVTGEGCYYHKCARLDDFAATPAGEAAHLESMKNMEDSAFLGSLLYTCHASVFELYTN